MARRRGEIKSNGNDDKDNENENRQPTRSRRPRSNLERPPMKPDEIRKLSDDELIQKEQDLKEEYFNLRFQFFTGQLESNARMKSVRRDIARALSIRGERSRKKEAEA